MVVERLVNVHFSWVERRQKGLRYHRHVGVDLIFVDLNRTSVFLRVSVDVRREIQCLRSEGVLRIRQTELGRVMFVTSLLNDVKEVVQKDYLWLVDFSVIRIAVHAISTEENVFLTMRNRANTFESFVRMRWTTSVMVSVTSVNLERCSLIVYWRRTFEKALLRKSTSCSGTVVWSLVLLEWRKVGLIWSNVRSTRWSHLICFI